ncbi:MAG: hypothetical protein U1E65_07735 [Myxococcota bacterium]
MLSSRLQRLIEELYRVEGAPPVEDFCVEAQHLGDVVDLRGKREMLVIVSEEDSTDVGLFLAPDVISGATRFLEARAGADHSVNIDDFCVALEGVSHFVYFMFCGATQARPVSLIELELQAELDKFLFLRLLCPLPELRERLFARFTLRTGLSAEEQERYQVANARAHRYARWLDEKFARGDVGEALEDARQLYRKPLEFKLDHIDRAA